MNVPVNLLLKDITGLTFNRSTRPRLEKVLDGTRYVLEENDARYTLAIPKEAIEANPGLLN